MNTTGHADVGIARTAQPDTMDLPNAILNSRGNVADAMQNLETLVGHLTGNPVPPVDGNEKAEVICAARILRSELEYNEQLQRRMEVVKEMLAECFLHL